MVSARMGYAGGDDRCVDSIVHLVEDSSASRCAVPNPIARSTDLDCGAMPARATLAVTIATIVVRCCGGSSTDAGSAEELRVAPEGLIGSSAPNARAGSFSAEIDRDGSDTIETHEARNVVTFVVRYDEIVGRMALEPRSSMVGLGGEMGASRNLEVIALGCDECRRHRNREIALSD